MTENKTVLDLLLAVANGDRQAVGALADYVKELGFEKEGLALQTLLLPPREDIEQLAFSATSHKECEDLIEQIGDNGSKNLTEKEENDLLEQSRHANLDLIWKECLCEDQDHIYARGWRTLRWTEKLP